MSIATAIQNAQGRVADCYTAISNKGGTLPATQNLSNMPTAIASIPSGGVGYSELPSYGVLNGAASRRSGTLTGSEFSNITSIGINGLSYAFYRCNDLRGQLNFSSLTSVNTQGLYEAFHGCYDITSIDLSSLISIGKLGLSYAFAGCGGYLKSVSFTSLTSIGDRGLSYTFDHCHALVNIYFNSLTTSSFGTYTNQFDRMLYGISSNTTHKLHFPSNLETTIQGLDGYPTFGGTSGSSIRLVFDLPATS